MRAIETPTVLILGAGASQEYGFPLGAELLSGIRDHCRFAQQNTAFLSALKAVDLRSEDAGRLAQRIDENIGTLSIDVLLEQNPDLDKVGKCAIAYLTYPHFQPGGLGGA